MKQVIAFGSVCSLAASAVLLVACGSGQADSNSSESEDSANTEQNAGQVSTSQFSSPNGAGIDVPTDGVVTGIEATATVVGSNLLAYATLTLKRDGVAVYSLAQVPASKVGNSLAFTIKASVGSQSSKGQWTLEVKDGCAINVGKKPWCNHPNVGLGTIGSWTLSLSMVGGDNPYNISMDALSYRKQFATAQAEATSAITGPDDVVIADKEWNCRVLEAKTGSNASSTVIMRFHPPQDPQSANFVTNASILPEQCANGAASGPCVAATLSSMDFQVSDQKYLTGMIANNRRRIFLKGAATDGSAQLLFEDEFTQGGTGAPASLVEEGKVVAAYGFCSSAAKRERIQRKTVSDEVESSVSCSGWFTNSRGWYAYACHEGSDINPTCRSRVQSVARGDGQNACTTRKGRETGTTSACTVTVDDYGCDGSEASECSGDFRAFTQREADAGRIPYDSSVDSDGCGDNRQSATASWSFTVDTPIP